MKENTYHNFLIPDISEIQARIIIDRVTKMYQLSRILINEMFKKNGREKETRQNCNTTLRDQTKANDVSNEIVK